MVIMAVPKGFLLNLWSFFRFLPFFFSILILGLIKAIIIGPVAVVIIFVGNSSVIIGLWPAHFIWTYYCVTKTKRLGLLLKILVLVFLPVPLVLWPILGITGSLLVGIGHGIFTPLIATFEASGEQFMEKVHHYFFDGCLSTLKDCCTIVQDFTDFCFHSYFSYMDELSEKVHGNENPMDVKLMMLPSCLLITIIAIPLDVLLITTVALCKSPSMLFRGWKRLFEDLIGREGPFLETFCVPFAGLAIILWPIAVVAAVLCSFICSFFLGFYSGVIVHQENSFRMGLAYMVSVVSLFDEYANDLLYFREGSCLPRPKYRRSLESRSELLERSSIDAELNEQTNGTVGPHGSQLVSKQSRTLKWAIQQLKPVQVWDWLFRSCEVNGRILVRDGVINIKDIEECIVKGKCNKLGIKLPAWCILQCVLSSAKSNSTGLLMSDDVDMARFNWTRDKLLEWFIGPLLIMKEQIRALHLTGEEEACLRNLIMSYKNESPEDWENTGFPSDDNVRRAQLQAIFRRLQGIVASMTRMPTFRRRFYNLVKVLYIEALKTGASASQDEGDSTHASSCKRSGQNTRTPKPKDILNFSERSSDARAQVEDENDIV